MPDSTKPLIVATMGMLAAVVPGGIARAQGPAAFDLGPAARQGFAALWKASVAEGRERVACLGGTLEGDTVHVSAVRALPADSADDLNAGAEASLAGCGPPEWVGTVHTHVRSIDDPSPSPYFSPGDRTVMSAWAERWKGAGAFCLLYSARAAKCEVYPPRQAPRALPPGGAR
jgi:hypothetical protein